MAAEPADAKPAVRPARVTEKRTTSTDLSDLLNQLGDGTAAAPAPDDALTDPRDLERPEGTARAVVESTGAINFRPEFASFGSRVGGWAIDTAISTAALMPGFILFIMLSGMTRLLAVPVAVAGFGLVAWSYTRAITRTGQWVGNRMMSTKVVRVSSGELLDAPRAFTRFAVRSLVSPIFFVGFLMALTSTSRRTFHDQFADSIVTRPTRQTWSISQERSESAQN